MIFNKNLREYVKEIKDEFDNNVPFEHIVIKDLFNESILRAARDEIETYKVQSKFFNDSQQIKHMTEGSRLLTNAPLNIKHVFNALNSSEFLEFLRQLTGIADLYADNTFRGGGIHQIPRGGKLGVHIDFSRPKWNQNTFRRANVLLYLNEDWQDVWGGHLELWDNSVKNGGKCVTKVNPSFNTLVIFGTKKQSWHGHPHRLMCPPNRKRQSFASYYYSNTPSNDLSIHSTIFE